MLFVIVVMLLILKFLLYLWNKRRVFVFVNSLRNDMDSNIVAGHTAYFIGDDEKKMTAICLFGREAIKQGGLTKIWVAHRCGVVVADAEIADLVLRTCLEKPDIMKLLSSLYGNGSILAPVPIWRPRRKILAPAFAQRNLNKFVALFDNASRRMVEKLHKNTRNGPFSLWKYMTAYSMDSVCATTLDIDLNTQNNVDHPFPNAFEEYSKMACERICSPWLYNDTLYEMIPWYSAIKTHISAMWKFVDDIIQTKRKTKNGKGAESAVDESNTKQYRSLVDLLMKPSGDGGYTDLELREELLVVTIGATDTSATGAAFVIAMLARSSSIRDKVQQEIQEVFGDSDRVVTPEDLQKMKYLDAVVRETLRLYPPVPVIGRTTDRDLTLPNGTVIPKDCDIALNLWALLRNPRYWGSDAEEFKPERFLNGQQYHPAAFAVFSYGPRSCSGHKYAMLSMKTVVCNLLRHFTVRHPDLVDPVEQTSEPMRVKFDIMMKDVENFIIKLNDKKNTHMPK